MADSAYARAGVDTSRADRAISGLVDVLRTIDTGKPSRSVLRSGHYAAVIDLNGIGLALSTDGVGSKVIVAEQLGRYDTVGIDCVAMNVNDLVCVGAEPIALLDYIAVEDADPEVLRQIAVGLKEGAEQAGVEIPGGELPHPAAAERRRGRVDRLAAARAARVRADRRARLRVAGGHVGDVQHGLWLLLRGAADSGGGGRGSAGPSPCGRHRDRLGHRR